MDIEDINPVAVLLAVVAFGITIYVSKTMGATVPLRIFYGVICGIVGYFVASFIGNSG